MRELAPAPERVLRALLAVYERDGRATVRTVTKEAGLASMNTAHAHLVRLRRLGLVTWEPNLSGTLRPLVVEARGELWASVPLGEAEEAHVG